MRLSSVVAVLAVVLVASAANASVSTVTCAQDNDGALLRCDITQGTYQGDVALFLDEKVAWGPSHVAGEITTDTPLDPAVWVIKGIENATSFTWTGYTFNVYMNQPFTLATTAIAPTDWGYGVTQVTSGSFVDAHGVSWTHKGVVAFTGTPGNDIAIGGSGDFGVKMSFSGSTLYNYQVEQMPVPEPATLALLALGGLYLARRRQ